MREMRAVSFIGFLVALGIGIQVPALPLFAQSLGGGAQAVGLVVSAFALMRCVGGASGGPLVRRLGARRMLYTGLYLSAVINACAGLSQSVSELVVLRSAAGFGSAMFTVAATLRVMRMAAPDMRGRASALYQGAFTTGTVAGPAIGSALVSTSPRTPFFVYAAVMVAAGLLARATLGSPGEDRQTEATPPRHGLTDLAAAFTSPVYAAATVTNFALGWTVYGLRMSLIPVFVVEVLHRGAGWVGVGLTATALTQTAALAVAGRLADVWGRRQTVLLGNALIVAAVMVIALTPALPTYLVGMCLMGLGCAASATGATASVADVLHGRGGTEVAVFGVMADLGMVVGPVAGGVLAANAGFETALLSGVVLLVVATGLTARAR